MRIDEAWPFYTGPVLELKFWSRGVLRIIYIVPRSEWAPRRGRELR